ncbi:hypothetical protein [Mycobacteroides abscessus]|uniref:hypothetical protein n=1 Tax=Mycobacteroides abscessus TaxID=36809 RepID=UPI00104237B3|nr:hypothetical protein [Mycobacteroides abscessus]
MTREYDELPPVASAALPPSEWVWCGLYGSLGGVACGFAAFCSAMLAWPEAIVAVVIGVCVAAWAAPCLITKQVRNAKLNIHVRMYRNVIEEHFRQEGPRLMAECRERLEQLEPKIDRRPSDISESE